MLYLRTGLPGSGKTLNTIREIELEHGPDPKNPNKPLRTVYYYGIPDLDVAKLKCKWVEFDTPDEWYNLPDGSIIVIDEAQRVFGAQDGRKARPEKVARFETHRHQGFDIYLITQHPSLIMSHVRKLVGKHINMYRPYGGKRLLRHEYEFCIDNPEKRSNFKLAQERRIKLDPAYYGVYKSATVHTHTFKLPNYVWYIPACIAVIAACIGWVWYTYSTPAVASEAAPLEQSQPAQSSQSSLSLNPMDTVSKSFNIGQQPMTQEQYLDSLKPRLDDVPMSAPRYDKLTEPKSFPRLVCAASEDPRRIDRARTRGFPIGTRDGREYTCQCYSQQITRANTSAEFCLQVVENGYFDDTRPDIQQFAGAGSMFGNSSNPAAATGRVPAARMPQTVSSSTVIPTSGRHAYIDHSVAQPPAEYVPRLTVVADSEYPSRPWR